MGLYEILDEAAEGMPAPGAERSRPERQSLEDLVLARLRAYAHDLQGHGAENLYELIMPQLERPLVRVAMELARGRQLHAAEMLGIHRNTLRQRLRELGLAPDLGR